MRPIFFIFVMFLSTLSFSQSVSLDSIAAYEGKRVTIFEKVESTYQSKGEKKTTYLNFGKPYPDSLFSVVIFEASLKNFSYSPADYLKGKRVRITGVVKMYKGKPQFVITEEKDIEL